MHACALVQTQGVYYNYMCTTHVHTLCSSGSSSTQYRTVLFRLWHSLAHQAGAAACKLRGVERLLRGCCHSEHLQVLANNCLPTVCFRCVCGVRAAGIREADRLLSLLK